MAGTNAYVAKKALMDRLKAAAALEASPLYGVEVDYAWTASSSRERIYGGRVPFDQEFAALRGGGRVPRDEQATVSLFIEVTLPGGEVEETDARVTELGAVVENLLAEDPTLGYTTNVQYGGVSGGELDYELTDGAVASVLELNIAIRSRLR